MNPALIEDHPLEKRVTCDCPVSFHLRVGIAEANHPEAIHACVRCGQISFTEVQRKRLHRKIDQPPAVRERQLTVEVRAWINRWPRVLEGPGPTDYVFLPASLRCADEKQLAQVTARLRGDQLALPRGRRLRPVECPAEPPPAGLPAELEDYRQLWQAVQMSPATDAKTLLHYANPLFPTSALATDSLLQRCDAAYLIRQAAANSDAQVRQSVYAIVSEEPSLLPTALGSSLAWMDTAIDQQGAGFDGHCLDDLLNFLAKQKSARAQIIPALEAAKSRLCRAAYDLSRKFTETIRTLKGETPLPISPTPWFFNS